MFLYEPRRETQMSAWARERQVQLISSTSIVQGQPAPRRNWAFLLDPDGGKVLQSAREQHTPPLAIHLPCPRHTHLTIHLPTSLLILPCSHPSAHSFTRPAA